jgi:hypothetical protein
MRKLPKLFVMNCWWLRERGARVGGAQERRRRGFAHGRQERRVFLLISCLIRLIHLLSLNREDYLTPKQGLNLIPKPNPNGPPGSLDP